MQSNRFMQISNSYSGFNFGSVYKSVITRNTEPAVDPVPVAPATPSGSTGGESDPVQREALMLQAAHRAAGRVATVMDAMPDV